MMHSSQKLFRANEYRLTFIDTEHKHFPCTSNQEILQQSKTNPIEEFFLVPF